MAVAVTWNFSISLVFAIFFPFLNQLHKKDRATRQQNQSSGQCLEQNQVMRQLQNKCGWEQATTSHKTCKVSSVRGKKRKQRCLRTGEAKDRQQVFSGALTGSVWEHSFELEGAPMRRSEGTGVPWASGALRTEPAGLPSRREPHTDNCQEWNLAEQVRAMARKERNGLVQRRGGEQGQGTPKRKCPIFEYSAKAKEEGAL